MYGDTVPRVQIPPSPPENKNGTLAVPFLFSGGELQGFESPFNSRSAASASEDAQRATASERPLDGFAAYWAANPSRQLTLAQKINPLRSESHLLN